MATIEKESERKRTRGPRLPFVKAIMLERNPDTGKMLPTNVVKAFDRISWDRMVASQNAKTFNWQYVEHLPCRPGNEDILRPEVTGGEEMSTYRKPKNGSVKEDAHKEEGNS